MDIPPGFRFCPSDKELLSYYLPRRLKGEPTQFQIPDVDVYGIEPWSLFNDIDHINDSQDIDDEATYRNNLTYVFTTIKKKHGNGTKKISRTVTTPSSKNQVIGTWKEQKPTDIIDMVSKKIIGVKRVLSFMPALSKQNHDDEDNEGTSKKRKRKQIMITNDNIIDQLDEISYIMHEYSMAGSSYVLCRIRRRIHESRKTNNKKMKYSSSCSKNITRKNTGWDDQGAEYDQPLHRSRMPHDDHHQMTTNTSVLLDHNQSSMLQQQQPDQGAEYDQQQGRTPYDDHHPIMMNTSVLCHDQSSMWQQQKPDQDAEDDQLLQGRMTGGSMRQQQQPVQSEAGFTGGSLILTGEDAGFAQLLEKDLLLDNTTSTSNGEDNTTTTSSSTSNGEMMNAPIVHEENESSMRQQQQRQQPVQSEQSEAGVTCGSPILIDDEEAGFAQLSEDDLSMDNTTSTSTSNGDEDKITGTGHEEVEEEEEDLSNPQQQQQQQPPTPTSEREDNLSLLSSIDFQSDDSPDFGNLYFPPIERLDDPLDRITLWSY